MLADRNRQTTTHHLDHFARGMLGGALATALILGSCLLYATEAATVLIDPASATAPNAVEVDGCRLNCTYQADTGQPGKIVVQGRNPGTAGKTHAVRVTVSSSEPADRMSRVIMMPQVLAEVAGTLELPADGEATVSIPLAAAVPAGAVITVQLGDSAGTVIRSKPDALLELIRP